ncbi:MAG TPA: M20/M25/M40 family metallo-hydrolase [Kiritimatiellia bacterium]|nr:M20/M25/M40 family metallo-hydrolase [Kiritimatiellia bacterium]HMP33648.1 M20/M25/M40 family metallo-hydrolase [Kiritimatiellia bacterium]
MKHHYYFSIIMQDYLRATVSTICERFPRRHVWNDVDLFGCQHWIEAEIAQRGLASTRQAFTATYWTDAKGTPASKSVSNICVELPGTDPQAGTLIVGAHYDSRHGMEAQQSRAPRFDWPHLTNGQPPPTYWDTPGANDNTSSVAALLAMLPALHATPRRHTIHAVFWVNEEYPFYRNFWRKGRRIGDTIFRADGMGSYYHAERFSKQDRPLIGCIALDTMGCYDDEKGYASKDAPWLKKAGVNLIFPDSHNYVAFLSNLASRSFASRSAALFRKQCPIPVHVPWIPLGARASSGWSDDWSFWQFGIPAFCVTDTAYIRSPHYHRITDTPEKLNYPVFAKVVEGVLSTIIQLTR